MRRIVPAEKLERVCHDVEHGPQTLKCAAGRSGAIENQAPVNGARSPARKSAQRIHEAHGLAESGGVAFEDECSSLGREVARRKPGPPRGNQESKETTTHFAQAHGHGLLAVGDRSVFGNHEARLFESL